LARLLRAGIDSAVERVVDQFPEVAEDKDMFLDLVYEEFATRLDNQRHGLAQEFYRRFPEHRAELEKHFSFHDWVQSPEPLHPGDTLPDTPLDCVLEEDYELLQEVGRGGMAVVYHAWQPSLRRSVALKMIVGAGSGDPRTLARFLVEAEAVGRLQHPNIVQIYEAGQRGDWPFLALEFVEGGTLAQVMAGRPLPPRRAAEILEPLARAIHHAHERGIIHRDLTPANILLTDTGIPKISDFGLARIFIGGDGALENPEALVGTPSYMAPEQVQPADHEVGRHIDIYGLGAILYETLTGQPPFQGEDLQATLDQVENFEFRPPRQLQPGIPADLEAICLKCLHEDPQGRYATAQDLADDLKRFLLGQPIRARPLGLLARGWHWCLRNPLTVALLGFVALLVGITLMVSLASWPLGK
jgi:serine/threonine protein kinase